MFPMVPTAANAQSSGYPAWDQCSFNPGGTKICTFPETTKWKHGYGPFIYPAYDPSSPRAWCNTIRFDLLEADSQNEILDKMGAMYAVNNRVELCYVDMRLPYVRTEECNGKPETLGTFDESLSPYASGHPLYGKQIIRGGICRMPWYNVDGILITEYVRPPWREVVCKYGTPAIGPSGPFCFGIDLPTKYEELGGRACRNVKNPIDLANGNKYQREVDYQRDDRRLSLVRHYNSTVAGQGSFARNWSTDYDARLSIGVGTMTTVAVFRGDGSMVAFKADGQSFVPDSTNATYALSAQRDQGGVITGWILRDKSGGNLETYDAKGRLQSIVSRDNYVRAMSYSVGGWLSSVADSFGRTLGFSYGSADDPTGIKDGSSVERVTDPAGKAINYKYDAPSAQKRAALTEVTYQDLSRRSYLYEILTPSDPDSDTRADRLLGLVDERNNRLTTYLYDTNGNAISTERALGTDKATVTRTDTADAGVNAVVTVDGVTTEQRYDSINGRLRLASQTQPAGSGCTAATKSSVYDANGNATQVDDFNGERSCHAYDLARNKSLVSVRGLTPAQSCDAALVQGAALAAGAIKTTTQWHPDWDLPTRVASPGKLTSYVYNRQPDPSNGGALASCAPADALLPDGKPIAVLCKVIERATTDASGSAGFAAAADSSVAARTTAYTYNRDGQTLTIRDPRNALKSLNYYSTTSATSTRGDLQTIVQPNGAVQTFNSYNLHGDVLRATTANGLVTDYTYDARGRVTQTSVGGEITAMVYDPAGLVRKITSPNGYEVNMTYDEAQRLTGMSDKDGNSVTYTLDFAGNRAAESYRDSTGTLKRFIERSYDTLNRLFRVKGAAL